MSDSTLIPFWIVSLSMHGPVAFGVTAHSLTDALHIIESAGYSLPEDRSTLRVTERVRVADLDEPHVVRKMGPIVVRGIWYPLTKVGL